MYLIVDSIQAIHDVWLIGDQFLDGIHNKFLDITQELMNRNITFGKEHQAINVPLLFMYDYLM